jgi:leucyl-tRNA synthetase
MVSEKDSSLDSLTPEEIREKFPKWLGTFPYPYMNGSLHLGHAFSLSKVDFLDGYQRMLGKKALFPLGFHATGMPIRASADKLIREVELFGKDFSKYNEEEESTEESVPSSTSGTAASTNVGKATKGKLQAKSTGLKYQFQILESIGVPREEIHKFTDGKHWLEYFPPIAKVCCRCDMKCICSYFLLIYFSTYRLTALLWELVSIGDAPSSPQMLIHTMIPLSGGR